MKKSVLSLLALVLLSSSLLDADLLDADLLNAECTSSQLEDYRDCVDAAIGMSVCNSNSCTKGNAAASYNSELQNIVSRCCEKKKAGNCFKSNSRAYSQASKRLRKTNLDAEQLTRNLAATLRQYKRDSKTVCGAYAQLF
ncbi:MAG: hypothetical protein KDD62_02120 [Bdellovibrionales bacterium]|nr:hypothetical protein [Bdellovibrionales bacterium]